MGDYDVTKDKLLSDLPRTQGGFPRAGNVVIHGRLGKGGMGAVYLGRDVKLNVPVAVKVIPFHLVEANPDLVKRFQREAQAAAQVDHPNLMRVYTVDEEEGVNYLVLEFVDGESAAERLTREGPLPEADALDICIAVGEALSAAHAEGIIHRDIKPANVMVRHKDGRVKLADLGLAKSFHEGGTQVTGLTATGQVMGTPAYMSPEQARDASQVDPRTDVYSLGATLYALITGRAPHEATQLLALLQKVTTEEPQDPKRIRPELSDATRDVIERMMAKRPEDRVARMTGAVALMKRTREALGAASKGLARPQLAGISVPAAPDAAASAGPAVAKTLDDVTPDELAKRPPSAAPTAPLVAPVRMGVAAKLAIALGVLAALGGALGAAAYLYSQRLAADEERSRAERAGEERRREEEDARARREAERAAEEARKRTEERRRKEEEKAAAAARAAAEKKPKLPRRLAGRTGIVFLLVPSPEGKEFYVSRTEVTNAQYEQYDPDHKKLRDKHSPGDDHPVVHVSWMDASKFCRWLTRKEEKRCGLPTEDEWERAAREATDAPYPWGKDEKEMWRRASLAGKEDGYEFAAPAGTFLEGRSWIGAVDLSGNVWEFCDGWFAPEKKFRAVRGGSWSNGPEGLRCDCREAFPDGVGSDAVGFRCVMSAEDVLRAMEVE